MISLAVKLPWYYRWPWFIVGMFVLMFVLGLLLRFTLPIAFIKTLWFPATGGIIGFIIGWIWGSKRYKYMKKQEENNG